MVCCGYEVDFAQSDEHRNEHGNKYGNGSEHENGIRKSVSHVYACCICP